MRLEGVHHVTAITADARRNFEFYSGFLGLRLVKKTINFDVPDVYHLYYGDRSGTPGSLITFFEFPDSPPGRAGPGMIHRVRFRVASEDSLAVWESRLNDRGAASKRSRDTLRFKDPEGLGLELMVYAGSDEPLCAESGGEVPRDHALAGIEGADAFSGAPDATGRFLAGAMGFDDGWVVSGSKRGGAFRAGPASGGVPVQGAGSVHHVAWACPPADQPAWRERLVKAGVGVTPVIDRVYFRSIYFREPGGVLFEIATIGPGFDVDEPWESLGEALTLPPQHEHLRGRLESTLSPIE